MIKIQTPLVNKKKPQPKSTYRPRKAVREIISYVQGDASEAENQRTTGLEEFDGYTFYEFLNICQDRYNENTPGSSDDPMQ